MTAVLTPVTRTGSPSHATEPTERVRRHRRITLRHTSSGRSRHQAGAEHYDWCQTVACSINTTGSTHRGHRSDITIEGVRYGARLLSAEEGATIDGRGELYCEIDVEDMESVTDRTDGVMQVEGRLDSTRLREMATLWNEWADKLDGMTAAELEPAEPDLSARIVDAVRKINHLSIRRADMPSDYARGLEYDPDHSTIYLDRSHTDEQLADELVAQLAALSEADAENTRLMALAEGELEQMSTGAQSGQSEPRDGDDVAHPSWCDGQLCWTNPQTDEVEHVSRVIRTVHHHLWDTRWQLSISRTDVVRSGAAEVGTPHVQMKGQRLDPTGQWVDDDDLGTWFWAPAEAERHIAEMQEVLRVATER